MSHMHGSQEGLHDRPAFGGRDFELPLRAPNRGATRRPLVPRPAPDLRVVTAEEGTPQRTFWERIRERKVCKWTISYLAVAWLVLQLLDVLAEIWGFSIPFQRAVTILLGLAFFPVVVISWYHGERGRQRVSGAEALILSLLAIGSGLVMWAL